MADDLAHDHVSSWAELHTRRQQLAAARDAMDQAVRELDDWFTLCEELGLA